MPWNVTCEPDRSSLVFGGKQQRQYDDNDPADVGQLVNPVPAFGDPLVGFKGGVNLKMSEHWTFAPAVGFAVNLDEGSRVDPLR